MFRCKMQFHKLIVDSALNSVVSKNCLQPKNYLGNLAITLPTSLTISNDEFFFLRISNHFSEDLQNASLYNASREVRILVLRYILLYMEMHVHAKLCLKSCMCWRLYRGSFDKIAIR